MLYLIDVKSCRVWIGLTILAYLAFSGSLADDAHAQPDPLTIPGYERHRFLGAGAVAGRVDLYKKTRPPTQVSPNAQHWPDWVVVKAYARDVDQAQQAAAREFSILTQLQPKWRWAKAHKNWSPWPQVYEQIKTSSGTYNVMEYLPWPTLAQLNTQRKPSLKNILQLHVSILETLALLHAGPSASHPDWVPVLLKDFKPENVMVAHQVALPDLNLAEKIDPNKVPEISGNMYYISPDLIWGNAPVPQLLDIYGVGISIPKMIFDRSMFSDASMQEVLLQKTSDPQELLDQTYAGLQRMPHLHSIIVKSLRSGAQPGHYKSAIQMAVDLKKLIRTQYSSFFVDPAQRNQRARHQYAALYAELLHF